MASAGRETADPPTSQPAPSGSPLAGDPETVRLRIPTDPSYVRVVRVAVGAVAVRHGLDARALEDLRIAVDEALVLLLRDVPGAATSDEGSEQGDAAQAEGTVVLDLRADGTDALLLDLHLDPASTGSWPGAGGLEALERFRELVPPDIGVVDVEPGRRVRLRLALPTS